MLTRDEKQELLILARSSIECAIAEGGGVRPQKSLPGLLRCHGLFVTLRIADQLRGCIGYTEATRPLCELVCEVAVRAALEDPRFPPLTGDELARTSIEVSVLSPMRRIHSVEEIRVGEHGIMLELGMCRGLLLPQVATQYGWSREAFLDATVKKAGLYSGAWKDPEAIVYVFSAEICDEGIHDHVADRSSM